jgi:MATE family multidrug resistance protein
MSIAAGIKGPAPLPWTEEFRQTIALAGPLALVQIGQIAIQTIDTIMVGRLGDAALAAASLGFNLHSIPFFLCLGVVLAASPLAAQAHGARQPRELRRVVRQGLWVAIAIAIPGTLLLQMGETWLGLIGQPPDLARDAGIYVAAFAFGLMPGLMLFALRAFITALNRTGPIVVTMAFGLALNTFLNWLMIYGNWGFPRWELFGAGVASAIANWAMVAMLGIWLMLARPYRKFHVLGRFWRPDWDKFRTILRLGAPIGITIVMEAGMFAVAAFAMGWISTEAVAGNHIALQWAAITFMIPLGLGQAATVRVGHAVGRRDPVGARRAGWSAIALAVIFMSGAALTFWTVPEILTAAFLDAGDPKNAPALAQAAAFLAVAALFQLFDGMQVTGAAALRGLSDTRWPMIYAILGYWGIGLPVMLVLAFPLGWDGVGIWTGLAAGLAVTAFLMLSRFHRLTGGATGA